MSTSKLTADGVFLNDRPLVDLPVGVIFIWLSTELPSENYLWCDGSNYNKTTYAELYDIIKNTYGGGVDTPKVPNLCDRAPIGGIVNNNNALANTLNSNEPNSVFNTSYTRTGGNNSLLASQFIHTHTVTGGPFITGVENTNNTASGQNQNIYNNGNSNNDFTFGETGSSTSHLPPHKKVNYIIFAGKKTSTPPTINEY